MSVPPPDSGDPLRRALDHAARLLPAQGPITVFIHHNTLHAFEDRPFEEAVRRGAEVFSCQPYLSEAKYRDHLVRGRIRYADLEDILDDDLGGRTVEPVAGLITRLGLRLAMLQNPTRSAPAGRLAWFMAETDALTRVRPDAGTVNRNKLVSDARRWALRDLRTDRAPAWATDLFAALGGNPEDWPADTWEAFAVRALWEVCRHVVQRADGVLSAESKVLRKARHSALSTRHSALLRQVTGIDPDTPVNDLLIRFTAAFLDQGVSDWPLPDRHRGFLNSFRAVYGRAGGPPDRWLAGLRTDLKRTADHDAAGVCRQVLADLGVPEPEWDRFVSDSLLVLRGWAGMVDQVAQRPDRVAHPIPADSLLDFLAVRLLLDRAAVRRVAADAGDSGPLAGLRDRLCVRPPEPPTADERAFPLFRLAQVLGWSADELHRLTPTAWANLLAEVEGFDEFQRRRVLHRAYETRFYEQTLDALALHPRFEPPAGWRPRFQIVTCLDEREESFRRHVEEVAPDAETFGMAGFMGVVMYYRGAADAHYVPLCPVVVRPGHWVTEEIAGEHADTAARRAVLRRRLGRAYHQFQTGSRSFATGALLSGAVGVLATVPLVGRILFPRLAAAFARRLTATVATPPATNLTVERQADPPGDSGPHLGFSLPEMVANAHRLLSDTGMLSGFARLVAVLGHGSSSLNNPHKSAYDCGACGGSPGAANGRAAAHLLNDPRVRAGLADKGVRIPADTVFIGGLHNTCNDTVTLFDLLTVPPSHRDELARMQADLAAACARNAHERSRRFMSAPLGLSDEDARRHVEARSEDLAQTRPELGHATNGLVHVGRRGRTRGLYLDRRCFLTSYDPTTDPDAAVLTRILSAVVPVCGGINLEYYFSHVDPPGYGCGSKLPHNVTALLGVMDGAASDLRTGLPVQMTEIHEPVRLLIVVETTPVVMLRVMADRPDIGEPVRNKWVMLAVQAPDSQALQVYKNGEFRPYYPTATTLPRAATSRDWYRGWRDHLEFAEIGG